MRDKGCCGNLQSAEGQKFIPRPVPGRKEVERTTKAAIIIIEYEFAQLERFRDVATLERGCGLLDRLGYILLPVIRWLDLVLP
jgi:hypothetical protein